MLWKKPAFVNGEGGRSGERGDRVPSAGCTFHSARHGRTSATQMPLLLRRRTSLALGWTPAGFVMNQIKEPLLTCLLGELEFKLALLIENVYKPRKSVT